MTGLSSVSPVTSPSSLLRPVRGPGDIPPAYRDTAIDNLLAYHNLGAPHRQYVQAELLVGMCMDHRKRLRIPANFAYVMRAAGGNFQGLEFHASFAVAVGGVRAVALIGHDECSMTDLVERRDAFVTGLVDGAGWRRHDAEEHFETFQPRFEIGDPIEFVRCQACCLRVQYPRVTVPPLFHRLGDGMLYVIDEQELQP